MKEFYVAPEAEIVRFVAQENIADDQPVSILDSWGVENGADGNISVDDYDKWFN